MPKATKPKAKARPAAKPAKAKSSWSETMKQALKHKRPGGGGPEQPKPRDSGTSKIKKDWI